MLKINDILRAQSITRWHMLPTIKEQSVAEHSYNVAIIGMAICQGIANNCRHPSLLEVLSYSLIHDLSEILTGDIPTPAKKFMQQQGFNFSATVDQELLDDPKSRFDADTLKVVWISDLMETTWFLENFGHGVPARQVLANLLDRLEGRFQRLQLDGYGHIERSARQVWSDMQSNRFEYLT